MPYAQHTKCTFSGVFGDPASPLEIWQFDVCLTDFVAAGPAELTSFAEDAANAFYLNLGAYMASDVHMTRVRAAKIASTGRVVQDGGGVYQQGDWNGDLNGSASGPKQPLQTALVISLVTARGGPTGKGRFYLPLVMQTLDSSHELSVSDTQAFANASWAFLNAMSDIGAPSVVVASRKGGYNTLVNNCRVGRVPDTQRRRRGALAEGYVFPT